MVARLQTVTTSNRSPAPLAAQSPDHVRRVRVCCPNPASSQVQRNAFPGRSSVGSILGSILGSTNSCQVNPQLRLRNHSWAIRNSRQRHFELLVRLELPRPALEMVCRQLPRLQGMSNTRVGTVETTMPLRRGSGIWPAEVQGGSARLGVPISVYVGPDGKDAWRKKHKSEACCEENRVHCSLLSCRSVPLLSIETLFLLDQASVLHVNFAMPRTHPFYPPRCYPSVPPFGYGSLRAVTFSVPAHSR